MLQIIGWVLCAMLFANGLAMFGNPAYAVPNGQFTKMNAHAKWAAWFCMIAALVFAVWLYVQGRPINDMVSGASYSAEYGDMAADPKSEAEVEAEADTAMKASNDALKAADAAIEKLAREQEGAQR